MHKARSPSVNDPVAVVRKITLENPRKLFEQMLQACPVNTWSEQDDAKRSAQHRPAHFA